jgi:hypothetical protein
MSATESSAIVAAHAAFIESGVAIELASRDAARQPHMTIGCGCRTDAAAGQITILVNRHYSGEFLAAVAASAAVAVNFGRPSDHCALQLKGVDARVAAPAADDDALIARYLRALSEDMQVSGFPPSLTTAYLALDPLDCVAVVFTPRAAYTQTPGPAAGEALL